MSSEGVGASLPRLDGIAHVTGASRYPQDIDATGCLVATTVRAGVPHARLREIDASDALAVPGVLRVLTHRDVRGSNRYGLIAPDQPVLVDDRVRTTADVVALVIAESAAAAREGARRVRVTLEPLPVVADMREACLPDAPAIHPERTAGTRHPNVLAEQRIAFGDAISALANAPVVIEAVYTTGWVEHAFLAPEAGVAAPDGEGLTLWTATQWPHEDLRQAAAALAEPLDRLRLVQQAIGGAFGGREDISLQILLLLAVQATGRRVRMLWDRRESIAGHGKRHPFRLRYRLGADDEGRLLALHANLLTDAGGYASSSAVVLANAVTQAAGPYAVPHVLVEGRAVYTNNPTTCAFRGFGVNQVNFALEQTVNRLAERLRLDPIAVRRRNIVRAGGTLATGQVIATPHGLDECLERAWVRAAERPLPPDDAIWSYGRGVACALKNAGYAFGFDDHATARVTLGPDRAEVQIAAADVGQGVATILSQIAAEELQLPAAAIALRWRDTAAAPEAGSTSASHQTIVSGNAVRRACARARRAYDDAGGTSASVTVCETYHAPGTAPVGASGQLMYAFSWSACAADVAVDRDTGRVRVLRLIEAVDAGRVINPTLFRGQVEGGAVMGQGYALQERFVVLDGTPLTTSLGGCNLPTALDAARAIDVIAVETPDPIGPYGARGIGEVTMLPVVPAITAAIQAATGVWVDALPATPEQVLSALEAAQTASSAWRRTLS